MKKQDLKDGMVIETREVNKYLIKTGHNPLGLNCDCNLIKKYINKDLTNEYKCNDIMKVYEDYTCKKVLWERKEKPELTDDERVILRNLPREYKYIVRDSYGNLKLHTIGIKKEKKFWYSDCYSSLILFNHLFQFITWEDEEPYLISDLLKEDN